MSLDFDVSKIKKYNELYPGIRMFPESTTNKAMVWNFATEVIVWSMLAVGMQRLTESNYDEFWRRYSLICEAMGTDAQVTLTNVHEHVGLTTNVSNWGRKEFSEHLKMVVKREAQKNARLAAMQGDK